MRYDRRMTHQPGRRKGTYCAYDFIKLATVSVTRDTAPCSIPRIALSALPLVVQSALSCRSCAAPKNKAGM